MQSGSPFGNVNLPTSAGTEHEDRTGRLSDDGSGHARVIALQVAAPAARDEIGVVVMGDAHDLRPWLPHREREA